MNASSTATTVQPTLKPACNGGKDVLNDDLEHANWSKQWAGGMRVRQLIPPRSRSLFVECRGRDSARALQRRATFDSRARRAPHRCDTGNLRAARAHVSSRRSDASAPGRKRRSASSRRTRPRALEHDGHRDWTRVARRSAEGSAFSRYHAEAGVAAEHCLASSFGDTRWDRIVSVIPARATCAVRSSHAQPCRRARRVAWTCGSLALLGALAPPSWLAGSYLWFAVLADLHRRAGHLA